MYARVSVDRTGLGQGVDRQVEDCLAKIARESLDPDHRMTQADIFIDNDESAWRGPGRPEFSRLLDLVRAGIKRRIVIGHQDRLVRQPRELEVLIDLANRHQVTIISVYSDGLDLSNSDDRLVARLLVAVASKASEDTSRRVSDQKAHRRRKGLPLGGPRPFGWENSTVPRASEVALIRTAMDQTLRGVSLNDIARRWNEAGVPQPQTGDSNWTPDIVRKVLINPRHAGLAAQTSDKRGRSLREPIVLGEATWPAVVPRDVWQAVTALLESRGAAYRTPRRRSLLTGLVTCAHCGQKMRRSGSGQRKVWRCPIGMITIDAAGLERLLVEATMVRLDNAELAAMVRQSQTPDPAVVRLIQEDAEIDRRSLEVEASLAKTDGSGLPIEVGERLLGDLRQRKRLIQKELAKLATSSSLVPYAGDHGALRTAWPALTLDQRRTILSATWRAISIVPAKRGLPRFDPDRVELVAEHDPVMPI